MEQLVRHLEANEWRVDREAGAEILHTGFSGKHCEFRCAAAITSKPEIVQFMTIFPMVIPVEKLSAISEFCARANWQMMLGRFELGWQERQLRFHASAPFSNCVLDDGVLQTVVGINMAVVDRYFEAVTSVLYAGLAPEDAVRNIEEGQDRAVA